MYHGKRTCDSLTKGECLSSDPVLPPADQAPKPQPSRLRWVFVGREGLRAGWSALIFVLIFYVVVRIGLFALQRSHLISQPINSASDISLSYGFLNEALTAFAVLLATWIMSKIERRGRSCRYG